MDAADVRAIHETGKTHEAGIAAVERTTKAFATAADQELPRETIIDTWKANLSDPGGIAGAIEAATAAAERDREERETRRWEEERNAREQAIALRFGGTDLFHAHQADLDPNWSPTENSTTTRENINAALGATESDTARLERLRVVRLSDDAEAGYREELGKVAGQFNTSDLDRAIEAGTQKRKHQTALRGATALTLAEAARSMTVVAPRAAPPAARQNSREHRRSISTAAVRSSPRRMALTVTALRYAMPSPSVTSASVNVGAAGYPPSRMITRTPIPGHWE